MNLYLLQENETTFFLQIELCYQKKTERFLIGNFLMRLYFK